MVRIPAAIGSTVGPTLRPAAVRGTLREQQHDDQRDSAFSNATNTLAVGADFALDFDNGNLNNGLGSGFTLLNSSADTTNGKLFEFSSSKEWPATP